MTCYRTAHTPCLGLGKSAYLGGFFECADGMLFAAKNPASSNDMSAAAETAHELVRLKGQRLKSSSQVNYASALHRFLKFTTDVCKFKTVGSNTALTHSCGETIGGRVVPCMGWEKIQGQHN